MTWLLARWITSFSLRKVFIITMSGFLLFFVLFSCFIYPYLITWQKSVSEASVISTCFSMLFYVIAELWKPALINILFWGLLNQTLSNSDAKRLYAPLFLGSSLGAVLAGPVLMVCNSENSWRWFHLSSEKWTHSLIVISFVLVFIGMAALWLYDRLYHCLKPEIFSESLSLNRSLRECVRSKPLLLLSGIVLADYIAYSLGEVVFLDILKRKFPHPCDYCRYLGYLSSLSSALTILIASMIAPIVLRKCRWVISALILPLFLLLIEGIFFICLRSQKGAFHLFGWTENQWLWTLILLGSLNFSLCRALKYTFFDASKELAFVSLPEDLKLKGKLMIDGLGARLGRGGSSALSLLLIEICGGVLASSLVSGIVVIVVAGGWIWVTQRLSESIESKEESCHAL